MRDYDLTYDFDQDLHEVPNNALDMELFVEDQIVVLNTIQKPEERVQTLGRLGTYLRILRRLSEAQSYLEKSLEVIARHKMPVDVRVQQQIRLAHVYQWQKKFAQSNAIFSELIMLAQKTELGALHDFIWQHSGKNEFDQHNWSKAYEAFDRALKLRQLRRAPADQIRSSLDSVTSALQRMN
ncbi:MAG: hypothetical protein EOP06_11620 [Proteobacteria bacterium]|nr:MAG: hypothetical protein EOP06_11620 [Pseudomonadota bacterium]